MLLQFHKHAYRFSAQTFTCLYNKICALTLDYTLQAMLHFCVEEFKSVALSVKAG